MKILIISDAWFPQVNGVVRTYEYLIKELEKKGHEVKVISPSDFPLCWPMPGYAEIKLALFPYNTLCRMIDAYKPDRIHLSTEGPLGWAGRRYCLKHGRGFSSSFHTLFPDYVAKRIAQYLPFLYAPFHAIGIWVVRTFHAPSKAMTVATDSLEQTLRGWGFKNPMYRVTRGANLEQFFSGEDTVYKNLKKPVAIYVGRVAIEKSIEDFLEMNWHGSKVIIGDGPSKTYLEKKYPDAHFVGIKKGEELAAHYRSADVFVFPSRTDTFGIVLIEALASGVPVAAYNVTGPKDIITESFLGVLTDSNLSTAAKQALDCGTAAQRAQFVKSYYTWENAGDQFAHALFDKIK